MTSVDSELDGDISLQNRLSKLQPEWKLVGTKVFLNSMGSLQCWEGMVLSRWCGCRDRNLCFHWKDYSTLFPLKCCASNLLLYRFRVGRGSMGHRCPEIKSYCSCSLNHNNEFGLTRSINYSGLESITITHIRWVRGEGPEQEDNKRSLQGMGREREWEKGWYRQSSIVCKSPTFADYFPGLARFSLEFH